MQLASRAAVWFELVLATAAIGAAALGHARHRPQAARHDIVVEVALMTAPVAPRAAAAEPIDCDVTMPADVERAYRDARFADAARAARAVAGCERTADLLTLLDAQWLLGKATANDAATRLIALQQARSTDLSLGGAHADELDHEIAEIASRAAEIYLARARETGCADVDAAARALDDAALLGVHDEHRAHDMVRERAALHCAAMPSLAVYYYK